MSEDLLRAMGAQRAHLELESGLHGDLRLDLDAFFDRPNEVAPHLDALATLVEPLGAEVICGPFSGGALVAWAGAEPLGLRFAASEREATPSGSSPFTYQYQLTGAPGRLARRRVVVVDDVVNAGSATAGSLTALRGAGGVPVGIGALLVLGDAAAGLAQRTGVPLVTTATARAMRWEPERCPLCATGEPLI